MSLVIVRCRKCGTRLGSLDEMPEDWSGSLTVVRCRKCVIPTPRRLIGVLQQQNATGFALMANIPLADLQRHALKAQRKGKAVSVNLEPISRAE